MNKKSKAAIDLKVDGPHGKSFGKKHHHAPDYAKNVDADVIPKGTKAAVPDEHWVKHIPASAEGFGDDPEGAFLPRPGKNRAQPHEKINECDH